MCSEIEHHLKKTAKHWTMLCPEKLEHIAATASKTRLSFVRSAKVVLCLRAIHNCNVGVSVGIKLTTGIPCQVLTQSAGAISACPGPANIEDPT